MAAMIARVLCWLGWHQYQFHHRDRLIGKHYTRYDICSRCDEMKVRGERL